MPKLCCTDLLPIRGSDFTTDINEMIVKDAIKRQEEVSEQKRDDDDSTPPADGGNRGALIVDATCASSNIRFPQDVSLLNEARESAETMIDELHE